MKLHRILVLSIMLPVICCTAASSQSARGGIKVDKDFFPIMPWGALHGKHEPAEGHKNGLESIAECNFTVSPFIRPDDLPLAEKLGLKAIIALPDGKGPWENRWADATDEATDSSIREWIEQTVKNKAVLGYFIMDEPGTPRFATLGKAVAAVHRYAPGKLAYINLFPGYATIGAPDQSQLGAASFTEYLERFVSDVKPDILSYDDYMVTYSDNLQNPSRGSIYFKDLLEVRRVSQKYGIPFWNTVCSNRIRPYTTVPSPANLLLQAYTTLAAGGRGLAWYTYYDRGYGYAPINASGGRSDTWYYLQMVNRQVKTLGPIMNRLNSTGVFFTTPAPADNLPALPGKLVKQVESLASRQGHSDSSPPIMIGEFEGEDGNSYVMLVNLSPEKSTNLTLQTQQSYSKKEVISAVDRTAVPLDEVNGHWLVPGQGVLIKLIE